MFNQSQQNSGIVSGNVQMVLQALRSAAADAANVCQWVVSQTPADLQSIGFGSEDVTLLQAICSDIVTLLAAASGGPAAPVKDYLAEALPLIGPNR